MKAIDTPRNLEKIQGGNWRSSERLKPYIPNHFGEFWRKE